MLKTFLGRRDEQSNRLKLLGDQEATTNSSGTCAICYVDYTNGLIMDECHHSFCKDCFEYTFEVLIE